MPRTTQSPKKLNVIGRQNLEKVATQLKYEPESLGLCLARLRSTEAGITRLKLATLAGVKESTIGAIEKSYPHCNLSSVQAALGVFGLSVAASACPDTPSKASVVTIGCAVRQERNRNHWSQRELSTLAGVSRMTLTAVESDRGVAMTSVQQLLEVTQRYITVTLAEQAPKPTEKRVKDKEPLAVDRYAPSLADMLYGRSSMNRQHR